MVFDKNKSRRTRSLSPLRAAFQAMAKPTKSTSTPRTVSPSKSPSSPPTTTTTSVTGVITKIKAKETGKTGSIHKVISLKLTSKEFWAVEGQELRVSNRRCRLQYDPEASGHMRVVMIPAGTFEVVSANPNTGTIKIVVEDCDNLDSMQAYLYREAMVGSHFTLAEV